MCKVGDRTPKAAVATMSKELAALRLFSAYKKAEKRELLVIFDDEKAVLDDKQVAVEVMDILIADSEITAFTLTFGIWHIACLAQLESIPYQSASVHEALRVTIPVTTRFPCIVLGEGHNGSVVDGKVVSPGTMIGISAYAMHKSGNIRAQGVRLAIKEARVAGAGAAASSL
ncbi:putative cytochrome p450 protein [Botrytis fragariae]|uniref:Putative cytochrome p450 protein n=1 Tax=Botrytis fragariae TaxID=1964551 RepID=A0A8H6B4E1_9HELO|nr:putative cytochrome p450 protein [Botrytis fragariae]KAF5879010.1 putative cytochrome p450 protein [Botrytis fragariae]